MQKPIIKLEQFEGPYDLLLELVRQEKLNVSHISLREVTDHFLTYVRAGIIQPDLLADFLVVAATLLLLKIRAALPDLSPDEEEEVLELTDRVRIYQLYREQAQYFRETWDTAPLLPANFWGSLGPSVQQTLPDLDAHDLAGFYANLLSHLPTLAQPTAHLILKGRTLSESLRLLGERLAKVRRVFFHEAFQDESPQDTAVSFLAALEMARQQQVTLQQDKHFDTITIEKL